MRAVDVHQGLSPVLDVVRDYRWGRVEETFGEDPYLVGMMGAAYVRGLESTGLVATLKHFAGYSASQAARNHAPVSMGPRTLRDVILIPFELAIREGGARSVMNSYSEIDGLPVAADASLLTGILRDEWGFEGTVVSDYWSIVFLLNMHRVAGTPGEAGALSLAAGIDVELPHTRCYGEPLADVIRAGAVPEELVDRAARRVLRQKGELGLLDPGWTPTVPAGPLDIDPPEHRALARELADRSIVLLANDGTLPLTPGQLALVGPCAADPLPFLGCYSYPNHGVMAGHPDMGLGIAVPTLLDVLGHAIYAPGCHVMDDDPTLLPAAVEAAGAAELCVAVVGDHPGLFGRGTSGEGCDAEDLSLPGIQDELVEALIETGTPVVLVVISGRPYALGRYDGPRRGDRPGVPAGRGGRGGDRGRADRRGRAERQASGAAPAGGGRPAEHVPASAARRQQRGRQQSRPDPAVRLWPRALVHDVRHRGGQRERRRAGDRRRRRDLLRRAQHGRPRGSGGRPALSVGPGRAGHPARDLARGLPARPTGTR